MDALVEVTKQPRPFMVPEKDRHALNPGRITQPFEQIGKPVADQPETDAELLPCPFCGSRDPFHNSARTHVLCGVCGAVCPRAKWNMRPWNKETP